MVEDKLNILKNNKLISEKNFEICLAVSNLLKNDGFEEETYETFLTHLAFALERTDKKEKIDPMPNEIWESVQVHNNFAKSKYYCKKMIDRNCEGVSEDEHRYIIMHICNLLDTKN